MELMDTLRRFEEAHNRRRVEDMRACFHDDALIESVASGGRALGADATAEALRQVFTDGVYSIGDWGYEPISRDVVVSWTGARHLLPARPGVIDERVYRVTVGRDGLMWRVRLFQRREDAIACFEEQGSTLGLRPDIDESGV